MMGHRSKRFKFFAPTNLDTLVPADNFCLDRVKGYRGLPAYERVLRKRKVWLEPLFGEAKVLPGLRRFQLRGLHKVNMEALMTAAGQNLKRLLRHRGARKWPAPSSLSLFLKSLSIGPTLRPEPVH